MKKRNDYHLLRGLVPEAVVGANTVALLKDFGRYFDAFPSHTEIIYEEFLPRFRAWHPSLKDAAFNEYKAILRNGLKDADEDQRSVIVGELAELELMTKLANLAEAFHAGDVPNASTEVSQLYDQYRLRTGVKTTAFIDIPIEELLQDEFDDAGIKWRLEALNGSMRPLRPGDFGIIAGRPDKGKTTFIASEVTFFAPQLPPDRNILWLNNEGPGKRIIPRLYQSALDLSMTDMKERSNAGTLVPAYRQIMGGRLDRVRVQDIHGYSNSQVELIIEANNPAVIVYDMIDNIKGFGNEARTDLQLEAMYQWARERSVKYDCVGLATSQISNDGDGVQFPTLGMLKDSKTGKQGACDFQLMIGASNDPALQNSRFLGLPKNKLRRPDGPSDPRAEVVFDGIRSRYRDLPIGA